jgi:hypothetical protein
MDDLTAAIEAIEPWAKAFDQTGGPGTHLRVLITAARASQEAAAELDALKHDIARYVAIAAEQATELSALTASRERCKALEGALRELPEELFDGHAVLMSLNPRQRVRTSPENVSDVLDAVVKLIRSRALVGPSDAAGGDSAMLAAEREPRT